MAVGSSGHSMAVQASGPSMASVGHGAGASLAGPLQDKLNKLLLTSNSPGKPSSSGGLTPAGRYDNLAASLPHGVKVWA